MTTETSVMEKTEEAAQETAKKVSRAETGYAKNVANFSELIIAVKSFGESYNPSAEILTVAGLESLRDRTNQIMIDLQTADSAYRDAVNNRQSAFERMSYLTTRIKGAVIAAGIDQKIVEEINSISKKITGSRVVKEKDETGGKSVSQMSMDNRAFNFRQLVIRLSSVATYNPNETDLTLEALNAYVDSLSTLTEGLQNSHTNLNKARMDRDQIMTGSNEALAPVALRVKEYVKSVFSVKSPQYKTIKGLKFLNR